MPTALTLIDCLQQHAQDTPEHCAIAASGIVLSYKELAQLVDRQAVLLARAQVDRSSTVGICCANDIQHLLLNLAAIQLGAATCTIPSYQTEQQQASAALKCGVTQMVTTLHAVDLDQRQLPHVAHHPKPAFDPPLLFLTSGTTGEPKQVVHHSSDLVHQAPRHIESPCQRFACVASIEHNFSKRHRLYCLASGATNIFLQPDFATLPAQITMLNANVLHLSAFQAQELLAAPNLTMLNGIRLKLGGSHVPRELRQRLREKITPMLYAGYGTTETGAIAFTDPKDTAAGASVGKPLAGIEAVIRNQDRAPLAMGGVGEVSIRCKGMFRGYRGLAEKTADRLHDDWFYTGDMGSIDAEGRLHLLGRADDMFVFNSMNIFPQEIESLLSQHASVQDVAVVPLDSEMHGAIPLALLVLSERSKPRLDEIEAFALRHCGIRCPRQFSVVESIPRNASGKVIRQQALLLFRQSSNIRATIISALLKSESLDGHTAQSIDAFIAGKQDIRLSSLNLDSLARMELLVALETEFALLVSPKQFRAFASLNDIVKHHTGHKSVPLSAAKNPVETLTPEPLKPSHVKPLKLFRRVFQYCKTAAQLNKALETYEHRLAPNEVADFRTLFEHGQLIPVTAEPKFHWTVNDWLSQQEAMMAVSGKVDCESYQRHAINPAVVHFRGHGRRSDKTLLICFSAKNSRRMMIPHAAFLQHTNAAKHDVIVISDPMNSGFRNGVRGLGSNVAEIAEWVATLGLVKEYRQLRCFGVSAGSYPALMTGFRLNAKRTVCVGGRFPSERHVMDIVKIVLNVWQASRSGSAGRVILTFGADRSRDRTYAKLMAWLVKASRLEVAIPNTQVGHRVIEQLLHQEQLSRFLEHTLFAEENADLLASPPAYLRKSYPTT